MRHIYVHVPFCRRRCSYCDFSIAVRRSVPADRFVRAILSELERRQASDWWTDESVETLYLGGGTPSLLPPPSLADLIHGISERCVAYGTGSVSDAEVTIEANPEDVTPAAAAAWVAAGVTRVSFGIQSFDPNVLRWMHRSHTGEQSTEAVHVIRQAGIASVSVDLIFALPEELARDWGRDLRMALSLEPDHLSVYGLTVEPRTPLARWIGRGATTTPPEEAFARQFLLAHEMLTTAGFEHYEVSNYARPGQRSRHNQAYWSQRRYLGLGPSAHGFDGARRYWNAAPWTGYERRLLDLSDPTEAIEVLTPDQRLLEAAYLGLRTVEGVPAAAAADWEPAFRASAVERGWLVESEGRIRLSAEGWLRLDAMIPALTTSPRGG